MNNSLTKYSTGFTLIEILIVVFLVGMLYSLILPFTQRTYEKFVALRKVEELKTFLYECKRQAFLYGEKIVITATEDTLRAGNLTYSAKDVRITIEKPIVFYPLGTSSGGKIGIGYRDFYYEIEILSPKGEVKLIR